MGTVSFDAVLNCESDVSSIILAPYDIYNNDLEITNTVLDSLVSTVINSSPSGSGYVFISIYDMSNVSNIVYYKGRVSDFIVIRDLELT